MKFRYNRFTPTSMRIACRDFMVKFNRRQNNIQRKLPKFVVKLQSKLSRVPKYSKHGKSYKLLYTYSFEQTIGKTPSGKYYGVLRNHNKKIAKVHFFRVAVSRKHTQFQVRLSKISFTRKKLEAIKQQQERESTRVELDLFLARRMNLVNAEIVGKHVWYGEKIRHPFCPRSDAEDFQRVLIWSIRNNVELKTGRYSVKWSKLNNGASVGTIHLQVTTDEEYKTAMVKAVAYAFGFPYIEKDGWYSHHENPCSEIMLPLAGAR